MDLHQLGPEIANASISAVFLLVVTLFEHAPVSCCDQAGANLLTMCRFPVTCVTWGPVDGLAGHVSAPSRGCWLCISLAVGHYPPQLRGLVCSSMESSVLLPRHQLAAPECLKRAHPPHWFIRRNSSRSLLQSGLPLVPDLYSPLLLRSVNSAQRMPALTACFKSRFYCGLHTQLYCYYVVYHLTISA